MQVNNKPQNSHKPRNNYRLIDLIPEATKRSKQIVPITGYFILVVSGIDYLSFLIPFHLFEPNWALGTVGKCVEHFWSILLGLVMVFAHRDHLNAGELRILAWLSRMVLIIGICFLLLLPLAITNRNRIHRHNQKQLTLQLDQQDVRHQEQTTLLNKANKSQLLQLIAERNLDFPSLAAEETPTKLRQRLQNELEKILNNNQKQARAQFKQKELSLIKKTVKWSIGAILSGVMLIWIWILTDWARKLRVKKVVSTWKITKRSNSR